MKFRHLSLGLVPAIALVVGVGTVASVDAEPASEHRQYGPWYSGRLGGGGYWLDTRASVVPGRWYTWSDVGGIYRSDDDGASWVALHQNFPDDQGDVSNIRGMIEHADDPNRLVALTGTRWRPAGGIWSSQDGGKTWTKRLTGRFWGNAHAREFGRTLIHHPASPDSLVAVGQDGVWKSDDFGKSWTKSIGAEGLNPSVVMFDPADPMRVWLASYPLSTWSLDGLFEAVTGTYESTDGGLTWTPINDEIIQEVAVDPTDPARWIASGKLKMLISRDSGRSWTEMSRGLPANDASKAWEINPRHFAAMTVTQEGILAANGQGDLYRLPSGAEEWVHIQRNQVNAPDWWFGNLDPEKGWVYFGKSASSLHVDPRNPDRLLMTDWYALWESLDGGVSWSFASDGLENTVLHGVALHPHDPQRVLAFMGDNGLMHSSDGGITFSKVLPTGHPLYSNVKQALFAPSDSNVMWAIGNTLPGQWESSSVARSDDGGYTLTYTSTQGLPAGMGTDHFISAVAVDNNDADTAWISVTGAIGAGGGIYETRDAGHSWSAINDGLADGLELFSPNIWDAGPELAVAPDGTLMAIGKKHQSAYIKTTQSDTWKPLSTTAGELAAVSADPHQPHRWWIASQGTGLIRTDNNGETWTVVYDKGVSAIGIDAKVKGRLVIATQSGILLSNDNAESWQAMSNDMPHRFFPTVAVGNRRIIAGTKGNGIFTRPID